MKNLKKTKKTYDREEGGAIDWKDKYLRAVADYQNLERRFEQESTRAKADVTKRLLLQLLTIVDDVDASAIFINDDGLKIIKNKLMQFLKDNGVSVIEIEGKEYDPELAECIEVVAGENDNIVVEVLQKGYRLGDSLLREAKVKVSKLSVDKSE